MSVFDNASEYNGPMTVALVASLQLLAGLWGNPHWTTLPLGSSGELRYQVTPNRSDDGNYLLQILVRDKRAGRSRTYKTRSFGEPKLQAFRFRGEKDYSLLILT